MTKYEKLTDWLKNPQRLRMTFKEIEQIIEEHLPESAHKYRAWWGTVSEALSGAESSQCHAWRDAVGSRKCRSLGGGSDFSETSPR